MDYKKINELLKNISSTKWKFRDKIVHTEVINEVDYNRPVQGEKGETFEVYNVGLPDGMFLKITTITDSYGDNESVGGIEFVKGKEKTVTVYEF